MSLATDSPAATDPHIRLVRTTGIIGVVWVPLLFAAVLTLSSNNEPPLEATGRQAAAYLAASEATWVQLSYAASTLGMIASLWFFVAIGFVLARAEGAPPWKSAVAALSGLLLGAYGLLNTSQQAGALHGTRITERTADYAYHVGTIGFANAWIAIASFALCAGWVVLGSGLVPRWSGWWLVVVGLGLVVSRFVWTTELWLLPYLLFWAWVLMASIWMIRRPERWARPAAT